MSIQKIVEIGNDEQKKQIHSELDLFCSAIEKIVKKENINIEKIIIPLNFDSTVNEIQKTDNYCSVRGKGDYQNTVGAKIIENEGSFSIIVSPGIFSHKHDNLTRFFIYLHEFTHIINRQLIPKREETIGAEKTYKYNLYYLYDEYYCDTLAYSIIDKIYPQKSEIWEESLFAHKNHFINVLNDKKYYEDIKNEIWRFRFHGDVMKFMENISSSFDTIAITFTHFFSIVDYLRATVTEIENSKFYNLKTQQLFDYYKNKYSQNSYDLIEGMDLIEKFLENFGMKLEDTNAGMYCHVRDI